MLSPRSKLLINDRNEGRVVVIPEQAGRAREKDRASGNRPTYTDT